jgi:PAS domain S-box-containing protein
VTLPNPHGESRDLPATATIPLARARRHLMLHRLPLFAISWLSTSVAWVMVLGMQSPTTLLPGFVTVAGQLLLLVAAGARARRDPTDVNVRATLVIACVGLGASSTLLFVLSRGGAEVLAFVLLTLFLSAALLFAWGWRAELVVLAVTLVIAAAALPFSDLVVPAPAFLTAVLIGAAVSLAIAEGSSRAFANAARHRASEAERRRELEDSRDAYRDLAENARDFIYTGDLAGRITYVNGPLAVFIGEPVSALVGRFFAEFLVPHPDNPDLDAALTTIAAGGSVPLLTFATRTAAGVRWIEVLPSGIEGGDGRVVGVRGIGRDVTARKLAEEALRDSEERFRTAFDSASVGIVLVRTDGRALQVNRAFCAMMGYEEAELRDMSFEKLCHPDDVAATIDCATEALRGGAQSYRLEKRYRHKRGHTVWGLLSSALVRDARGEPLYFISQIQDITERKEAEDALRESERRYRGLVESQHDLIVRFDPALRLTFVNDAYCAKLGRPRAELLGHSWLPFVEPDDLPVLSEAMPLLEAPPYRMRADVRVRTAEGERWIAWEGSAIKDAAGATNEYQAVGRDVTERHAAERALRNSEERYRGLVQSQYDLVSRIDPEGHFTFVNDAYCRTYGRGREQLVGRRFVEFLHPDDVAATLAVIAAAEHPPHRGSIENRQRTAAGWRWIAWEGCVIKDAHGRTIELQAVGRDVTERRAAEEALRSSLEELRRGEERLRLLARRQARIREEERKRLGFDLHDNVCQELIGIAILVESLRRRMTPLPEAAASELDRIVRYLHELVEHLRMLARDMRPMLLRDLGLEGSLRSLVDGMASPMTRVSAEFASAIPRLEEELEVAVYRIAQEALANAVRHAGAGTIVVTLTVRDGRLELLVRDDGRGFNPSDGGRAQALGLVSMRERALALGGRFELESAPGKGTIVRLECPVVSRAAA